MAIGEAGDFEFPATAVGSGLKRGAVDRKSLTFYGYVIGFKAEWGYFTLGELEQVNMHGLMIERDNRFEPRKFSTCVSGTVTGLSEIRAAARVLNTNPEST